MSGSRSPVLFRCQALSKSYGTGDERLDVVGDVTLDIHAGEFVTIVGGSGVGKTTLLRMLGGLVPKSAGTLMYRDRPVNGPPPAVVFVFQDYGRSLLPWRTVEHNVRLSLEAAGIGGEERAERVRRALESVGLAHAAKQRPWQLSGGMQQRVQIARALAVDTEVLLMDEPFGSLDALTKARMQDELQALHRETGKTIVFITHDVDEAIYLADRTLVMTDSPGRISTELRVALPRPRDQISTREAPEFLQLRHEAHEALIGVRA